MHRIDRRSLIHALLLSSLLLAPMARADYCPFPPANAWPNGQMGTMDTAHTGAMCAAQSELWTGLNLEVSHWTQGYGLVPSGDDWTISCAVDDFLTRLLNAAHLLRDVSQYSAPFGLHRWVLDNESDLGPSEVDSGGRFLGDWWSFAQSHNGTEWRPGCNNDNKLATNHQWPQTYIELHSLAAYRQTALERAGTLVHETVHEDVGHLDDDACDNEGSCDLRYGEYNAQTMEIDFLYDAGTRYQLTWASNQLVRFVNVYEGSPGQRICWYQPSYSEYERNRALQTANGKSPGFFALLPIVFHPKYANADAADDALNPFFDCDLCQSQDWTFDPNQCSQTACNERLNAANQTINGFNGFQCFNYNLDVAAGGSTPDAIALAKANNPYQMCAPPEETATRAYCDAEKASAAHVDDLDSCGWMEGVYFPTVSRPLCIQEFCHERFQADYQDNGAQAWNPLTGVDPYGCLDAICAPDGESCNDDLSQADCRKLFVATHGDPEFFAGSCDANRCQRAGARCLADYILANPGGWQYAPDADLPPECDMKKGICELLARMSLDIFMSVKEFDPLAHPGLDPVIQHPQSPTLNPALSLPGWIRDYRMQMTSGTTPDARARIARRLTSSPEMVAGLFNLQPGRFVALFGAEGFEELIGPVIHQFPPQPIRPQDLTPQGQEALANLEALLTTLPPEQHSSAFGTIRSQASQLDADNDGLSDASDNCPVWPNPSQSDVDGNGSGDDCECGDQSGDGTVNVRDIVAINGAIFGSEPVRALCDANGDSVCNVSDMVAVNRKIFGGPAFCARSPAPGTHP
jgi:hypothetical protein